MKRKLLSILALLCLTVTSVWANEPQSVTYDVYVSPDGDGDGLSYGSPMSDLWQAMEDVPDGGSIFFLNGTYDLTFGFTLYKNVALVGESRDGVIIDFGGGELGFLTEGNNLNSISISGMTLVENNSDPFLIVNSSVQEVNITDCVFNTDDYHSLFFVGTYLGNDLSTDFGGTFNFNNNVLSYGDVVAFVIGGHYEVNITNNIIINENSDAHLIENHSDGDCNVANNSSGPINLTANSDRADTPSYWCTYYNSTLSLTADANTTVFQAALSGDQLTLTEVPGREIPADKAVILKSTAETITLTPATTTQTLDGNQLQGTTAEMTGEAGNIYVLNKMNAGVGFYKLSPSGIIGANKAYLIYSDEAREFFLFDEATGISATLNDNVEMINDNVYDLQGRSVSQPTKGLYIVNGKKVIIK